MLWETSSSSESDYEEPVRRLRFIQDRENPSTMLDEDDFKKRFGLNKVTATYLVNTIEDKIAPRTHRNESLSTQTQLLIA